MYLPTIFLLFLLFTMNAVKHSTNPTNKMAPNTGPTIGPITGATVVLPALSPCVEEVEAGRLEKVGTEEVGTSVIEEMETEEWRTEGFGVEEA